MKKKELKSPAKASAVFLPRPPRLASLARSSLTRVAASSTSIAIALSRSLALSHVPFRALGRAVGTSHAVGGFVRLVPGALVDAPDAVVLFQEAPGAPALVEVAPRTS